MSLNSFKLTLTSATSIYTYTSDIPKVIIGRSQKCDFVIPNEDLSREHCLFEIENGESFVTDLGSKNGVFINGTRLPPQVREKVSDETEVTLSEVYLLKFFPVAIEVKSKNDQFEDDRKIKMLQRAQTRTVNLEIEEAKKKRTKANRTGPISEDRFRYIKMASGLIVVLGYLFYKIMTE